MKPGMPNRRYGRGHLPVLLAAFLSVAAAAWSAPAGPVHVARPNDPATLLTAERLAATGLELVMLDSPVGFVAAKVKQRTLDAFEWTRLVRRREGERPVVLVMVTAEGRAGGVWVFDTGNKALRKAVSDSVAKWEFEPATKDGFPVAGLLAQRLMIHPLQR